jgi:hypothetical protein
MNKTLKDLLQEKEENEFSIAEAKKQIEKEAAAFYEQYLKGRFNKFPEGKGANMVVTYEENGHQFWAVNDIVLEDGYCIFFESTASGIQYPANMLNLRPELGNGYLGDAEDSETGPFDIANLLASLERIVEEGFAVPENSNLTATGFAVPENSNLTATNLEKLYTVLHPKG